MNINEFLLMIPMQYSHSYPLLEKPLLVMINFARMEMRKGCLILSKPII